MKKRTAQHLQFVPDFSIMNRYVHEYWYAPADALQRSSEASIFSTLSYKHPILEIGIGNGSVASYMYPQLVKVDLGIDIDPSGLAEAKTSGKYKKVAVENAEHLSLPSNHFATVVCNSTLEHVDDDIKAIRETGRVTKKLGLVYIAVPSSLLPTMVLSLEKEWKGDNPKRALQHFNSRMQHKHYRSLQEWETVLQNAHLRLESFAYYFPPHTTKIWYQSWRFITMKIGKRELWSWVGQSRLTRFIPQSLVKWLTIHLLLARAYTDTFAVSGSNGGMLFLVARKY